MFIREFFQDQHLWEGGDGSGVTEEEAGPQHSPNRSLSRPLRDLWSWRGPAELSPVGVSRLDVYNLTVISQWVGAVPKRRLDLRRGVVFSQHDLQRGPIAEALL